MSVNHINVASVMLGRHVSELYRTDSVHFLRSRIVVECHWPHGPVRALPRWLVLRFAANNVASALPCGLFFTDDGCCNCFNLQRLSSRYLCSVKRHDWPRGGFESIPYAPIDDVRTVLGRLLLSSYRFVPVGPSDRVPRWLFFARDGRNFRCNLQELQHWILLPAWDI